jgi:outer membrane receptor protein involved in Fe transport
MPRQQVATSPARTVDDLLREAPGVELPRTSSTVSGPEEIVSIRGVDEGRTLVLSDGVPLNDPWGEWIQWNRVPKQAVDRVEILEGGGSSLYGNYAMGGVIQLFRRPITERGVAATASGGSRGAADASLYGTTAAGPWGFALGADYGTGGGYTLLRPDQRGPVDRDSKVTRRSVDGRVEYALSPGSRLFASADLFGDDRELGTEFTAPNRRTIGSGVVGGSFGGVAGGRLDASVFGQSQSYDSRQSRVSPDRTTESLAIAQSIPSHDLGGSVQWARAAGIFETVAVGGDARYMHGRLDERVYDPAGASTGTRSSGGSQVVGGAFVQGVLAPAEPLRVEASARVDAWRSYDGTRTDLTGATPADTSYATRRNAAFSPRLGVRWAALPSLTLRTSAYRAFRAPTLSEQYRTFFSGPLTFLGAPGLGPEHLNGVDAGIDWRPASAVELRLTGFWNEMRELMTFVPVPPPPSSTGPFLQRQNVGGARSRGGEAELALRPLDGLTLTAVYNYDDARVTKAQNPAQVGTYVARVPLQRAAVRATYTLPALATFTGICRYEGPSNTIGGVRMGSFTVVDADLRTPALRGTSAFLAVENLLDHSYTVNRAGPLDYLGLPRTVRGGLTVSSF